MVCVLTNVESALNLTDQIPINLFILYSPAKTGRVY